MKADFIFFGGQSNMQGQTEAFDAFTAREHLYEYRFLTDELVQIKNLGIILTCEPEFISDSLY